ncbi:MAG: aminotransferase class III-fold pyridoxal phosphate-dependent enzyme [Bacteroidetes bacterium]|nr:aminotransferase class III-fold pyridoxal phosphate-dependent enzyme [Bacteroidota bacterium]
MEIERAEGLYLYGREGRRWLDLISGIAVSNMGHGHPRIVAAVQEQAARHMHTMVYGELIQSPQTAFAAKLLPLLPASLNNIYYVNSGSEAVEGALKLAKRFTGRTELIGFNQSYHGSTHGAISIGGTEAWKAAFRPLLPDVRNLDYGVVDQLSAISGRTAAVLIEPVQAESGVTLPPKGYLEALRSRCAETGALLIFDESQTGCGRTGTFLALEHSGVVPDILVMAKAFGGGMPLGAFIASQDVMKVLTCDPVLGHITTFGGHPLSCAAGLAALTAMLEEERMAQVPKLEAQFRDTLKHPAIKALRSCGLLMALELERAEKTQAVIAAALDAGLLTDWFLYAPHCVRIAPPLTITPDEVSWACARLLECLDKDG